MNREDVVAHMISYIENLEKDQQAASIAGASKAVRADVVNAILNELEQEVKDED